MIRINDIVDKVTENHPDADPDIIERAYIYSARVHHGQLRLSGEPYLSHPLEVAGILADMKLDVVSVAAGLLHDVIEDIPEVTTDFLRQVGFDDEIVDAVEAITHLDGESYFDYVVRLSKNEIAKEVKKFDLKHNSSLDRALYDPKTMEKDIHRLTKYVLSFRFLSGKIDEKEFEEELEEIYYYLLSNV